MKHINQLTTVFTLFILLLTSCSSDDDCSTGDHEETFNFYGTVFDDENVPIENATITLGVFTTLTDENGQFLLNNITLETDYAYIKAEKEDYVTGMRMLTDLEENNTVRFTLFNDHLATILGTGGDSLVVFPTGFSLTIDGNISNPDGSPYSGFMYPVIYHVAPTNPLVESIVPGNYNVSDDTYGYVYVKLEDAEKNLLDVTDGHTGHLYFHIDEDDLEASPDTLTAYNFNIETGEWEVIGEATKQLFLERWVYKVVTNSFSSHWFKVEAS